MRAALPLLATVLICPALNAQTWNVPQNGFDLLEQLQRDSRFPTSTDGLLYIATYAATQAYIIGVAETLSDMGLICAHRDSGGQILYRDMWIAVRAHLEQRTARLSEPAIVLVTDALFDTYPCS